MANHTRSNATEEIPRPPAKFNEAQLKFNEEVAKLKSTMDKVNSQLREMLNLLQLRSEGTVGQINLNPYETTHGSVVDLLHAHDDANLGLATKVVNAFDEIPGVIKSIGSEEVKGNEYESKHPIDSEMPDLEDIVSPESAIKHSIVEENEQAGENDENRGGMLPFVYVKSILGSVCESAVNGSAIGSLKAWIKGLISFREVVLNQCVMWNDAHKVFDEMTQTIGRVVINEQVIAPYTSHINSDKLILFDPGGTGKYSVSLSRGVAHPSFSTDREIYVESLKGVVLSLKHAPSIVAAKERNCFTVSNYSHIISSGSHAILSLIVHIIVHGDDFTEMDLKALVGEANSGLLMTMLSFDPGGCTLSQMGCDPFEFNGEKGEFGLTLIVVTTLVKVIKHKCRVLNVSVSGELDVKRVILDQQVVGMGDADVDPDRAESRSVYVKNLNFQTSEESLRKHFSEHIKEGRIRSVRVKKHVKNGKNVSMGFGFIELDSPDTAIKVCQDLQGTVLDGHALILEQCRLKPVGEKPKNDSSSTKLIVRNVAFEATEKDIRQLFSPFGQIKRLRLPRRFGNHRGFSFVEYVTKQEAKNALEALSNTHLYGRRLVLERAKEGESLEELRARTAAHMSNDEGDFLGATKVSKKRKSVGVLDEGSLKFERIAD